MAEPRLHILSVLVQNRAGVLARVSGLFARRAYNIESLAVAPTDDPALSRITIVVQVESTPLEQITKQLFKLIDVLKITELDPAEAVERELLLVSVRATPDMRSQVIEVVSIFEGTIVDVGRDSITASPGSSSVIFSTSMSLNSCLVICSRGVDSTCTTMVMRDRAGSSVGATASDSML